MKARRIIIILLLLSALAIIASILAPYIKAIAMAATREPPKTYPMPEKLEHDMVKVDDWFIVSRIDARTFAIGEPRYGQCNFSYLLLGSERALLWDSGPGIRDISRVVAGLTRLNVTAMPSHLHFDHIGGLRYFADVALPAVAHLRERTQNGQLPLGRFEFLGLIEGREPPTLRVTRWIEPGESVDLGERTLRVLAAPGHTDSSMVLVDETSGNMFTGDTIYPGNVWAFLPGTDLRAFRSTVATLEKVAKPGAGLFGGHGCVGLDQGLKVPRLEVTNWGLLKKSLDEALQIRPVLLLPHAIDLGGSVKLDAKAPWMAK